MRRSWLLPALLALGLAACGGTGETPDEVPATIDTIDTAAAAETAPTETGIAGTAAEIRALLDSTVTELSGAQSLDEIATILEDAGAQARAETESLPEEAEVGLEDETAQLRQGLMSLGGDLERIAGEIQGAGPEDAQRIFSEIQSLPAIEQINQALDSITVNAP